MKIENNKKYLFIVESPNKVKTISSIFKQLSYNNINTVASAGHITRLADTGKFNLGIDVDNNFEGKYEILDDKKQAINKLKELVKDVDCVILASDEDREGEAIAYHLMKELKIPQTKYQRVTYHSITKNAILEGIEHSRKIDMDLVNAALAREATDKIIGYRLTNIAKRNTGAKSVGRCQSAGLKILVEREKEIKAFESKTFYELYLKFNKENNEYLAKYIGTENNKVSEFDTKEAVDNVIKECESSDYYVKSIVDRERKVNPKPPFITSTFQQECINKLGMSTEKATFCSQKLFEGIEINKEHKGLITYIRTDSSYINPEFVTELKDFVITNYGKEFYSPIKQAKKKATDQEAHEAIRVLDLSLTPKLLAQYVTDKDLLNVYTLIYNRTLASSMSSAIYNDTVYTINNKDNLFQMTLTQLVFSGFKSVYDYIEDDEDAELKCSLQEKEKLENPELQPIKKETKPPKRYSESSLIKKLEDLGIGRPSTYNTIIKTLKDNNRGFCDMQNKSFIPTELGINTSDFLDKSFPNIINLNYTAELETDLDKIAQGNLDRVSFLSAFYKNLEDSIAKVDPESNNFSGKNKEVVICSRCGAPMQIKKGPYSIFWGCTNYPRCKGTESINKKR